MDLESYREEEKEHNLNEQIPKHDTHRCKTAHAQYACQKKGQKL